MALLLDLLEDVLEEPAGLMRGEEAMRVVGAWGEFFEAQLYELSSFTRHSPFYYFSWLDPESIIQVRLSAHLLTLIAEGNLTFLTL